MVCPNSGRRNLNTIRGWGWALFGGDTGTSRGGGLRREELRNQELRLPGKPGYRWLGGYRDEMIRWRENEE